MIDKSLTIQGPGAGLLTVSGNNNSRVFFNNGSTVTISGLTITGGNGVGNGSGSGGVGGGVFSVGVALNLNDCVVTGNTAGTGTGGGITAVSGALNLTRTTVSGNTADQAGGIYAQDETTVIRDSTISGNSGVNGEGLRNNAPSNNATMTLINSTVSGNTATDQNSAIRSEAPGGFTSTIDL